MANTILNRGKRLIYCCEQFSFHFTAMPLYHHQDKCHVQGRKVIMGHLIPLDDPLLFFNLEHGIYLNYSEPWFDSL